MSKVKTTIEVNGCIENKVDDIESTLFFVNVDSTFSRNTSFLFSTMRITSSCSPTLGQINNAALFVSATSDTIITFPSASDGNHFYLKRIDNNPYSLTLRATGSVLIENQSSLVVNLVNTSVHFIYYENWWIT